jgi:two-component system chemotaxis response regulator CheB
VLVAILTGMGQDGRRGATEIKSRGGYVIAQDAESSVVWGMPGAVVEAGLADQVASLSVMGASIVSQAGKA